MHPYYAFHLRHRGNASNATNSRCTISRLGSATAKQRRPLLILPWTLGKAAFISLAFASFSSRIFALMRDASSWRSASASIRTRRLATLTPSSRPRDLTRVSSVCHHISPRCIRLYSGQCCPGWHSQCQPNFKEERGVSYGD